MQKPLPELKSKAMRQGVADALRTALLAGHFTPGESLSEVELAASLKVSRGPVREALLILAEEGLVAHTQNRGFSVFQLTAKDFEEISVVRLPLETLALRLARRHVDAADIAGLQGLLKHMSSLLRSGDFRGCTRADYEFHGMIWEKAGNPWLLAALKRIMIPYFTFTMVYRDRVADYTSEVLENEHMLFVEFLQNKTSRSAEECVRMHLELDPRMTS